MTEPVVIAIRRETDIVDARQRGRKMAQALGVTGTDLTLIATAISEIARNILLYAGEGEILLQPDADGGREGLTVIARDAGPGIEDIDRALQDGFTTGGGLGLGLPGAKRLMDEFEIDSSPGEGTTVKMTKWCRT